MKTHSIILLVFIFGILACSEQANEGQEVEQLVAIEEQLIENENPELPSADLFEAALIELYNLRKYKAVDTTASKPYVDGWAGLTAWKNDFERCLDASSSEDIQALNGFKNITEVKQAFVKSEETIDGLYLKVHIEEWTFSTETTAENFEEELLHFDLDRECVSKGGFEWWRIADKFYFMQSNVFRFAFEFEDIRTILNSKLVIENQ